MLKPIAALCSVLLVLSGSTTLGQSAELAPPPEAMRARYDQMSKDWAPLPPMIAHAFIAGEDRKFRARYPAPSALTLQVAKTMLHEAEPTETRRAREFALMISLSRALTADEVLSWYANTVYLGQGCYGAEETALVLFGKRAEQLTIAEAAVLGALPRMPSWTKDRERLRLRRNFVLTEMAMAGAVSPGDADLAKDEPVGFVEPLGTCIGP